eukprot:14569571-Alexandrium_andersonii.AAC.1
MIRGTAYGHSLRTPAKMRAPTAPWTSPPWAAPTASWPSRPGLTFNQRAKNTQHETSLQASALGTAKDLVPEDPEGCGLRCFS